MNPTSSQKFATPPSTGGKKEKHPDLKPLSAGLHSAILFQIVNLGTQEGKFGNKPQIYLGFEFPLEKALFYKEDKEKAPYVLGRELGYNIYWDSAKNQKSTLASFLKNGFGADVTKPETIDMSEYIGKPCLVNIVHNESGGKTYANIENVMPFMPQMIAGRENEFVLTNDLQLFDISFGFDSENFAGIYPWWQDKIKKSEEGKLHASKGGQFAKYVSKKNNDNDSSAPQETQQAQQPQQPVQNQQQAVPAQQATAQAQFVPQQQAQGFQNVPENVFNPNAVPDDLPF